MYFLARRLQIGVLLFLALTQHKCLQTLVLHIREDNKRDNLHNTC